MDAFRFEHTAADDSGPVQKVSGQGAASESLSNIIRPGHFGLAYNAPVGSHGVALSPRGQADLAILLGLEDPASRPKNVPAGQCQLYDAAGNIIFMSMANGIQLAAQSGHVSLKPSAGGKVYLGAGADGAGCVPVMTASGPSSTVFCKP